MGSPPGRGRGRHLGVFYCSLGLLHGFLADLDDRESERRYWQVPGGGGPQSRDIPRHLPESIHRQASQRSCTSQRLGRLLLSAPRICQVSPSGTSLSFLPRARHHISHPLNPPERHFFHQIPSPPLSPTSHFPTINLSTFEQPTPTHPISPHPRRLALRLFTLNHQQPLLPLLTLSKCRAPTPTFPPAAKLPKDGPRPSHQPLRPPAEIAPPLRLSTVTSMVTMAMATANFPRYHSLTPHFSRIPKGPLDKTR